VASSTRNRTCAVLKVGGALLRSDDDLGSLARHVAAQQELGQRLVIVHGGGPEISQLHEQLGIPFEKRKGLRVTSPEGMEITTMVLSGLVNTRLVARLVREGIAAVGLSGVDAGLLTSELRDPAVWGRVGQPPRVDTAVLRSLLEQDLVPVISPVSLGPDGDPVNVNADEAAMAIAMALTAEKLDLVSDVDGVRTNGRGVARRLSAGEVGDLIARRVIQGGMVPKIRAATGVLAAGVQQVRIGSLASLGANTATDVTT
jgi:acetylglutamate kinase